MNVDCTVCMHFVYCWWWIARAHQSSIYKLETSEGEVLILKTYIFYSLNLEHIDFPDLTSSFLQYKHNWALWFGFCCRHWPHFLTLGDQSDFRITQGQKWLSFGWFLPCELYQQICDSCKRLPCIHSSTGMHLIAVPLEALFNFAFLPFV